MTGFGRASGERDGVAIAVEIRSVNHRYADIKLRLPQELSAFEIALRKSIQGQVARGRLDVTVKLDAVGGAGAMPSLQPEVARRYVDIFAQLSELLGQEASSPRPVELLQLPGVLATQETQMSDELLKPLLFEVVEQALTQLLVMREAEGTELLQHLREQLALFCEGMAIVEGRAEVVPEEQFQRLKERLSSFSLHTEVEVSRLHQEVALFSDRCDISEELARLKSHIQQFEGFLEKGGAVGRRLDFLCQEFLRETNTIGSKSTDATISSQLITMKGAIEKLREQVQNVE